jgi:ribosomal protein S18 acetylase RimI-like enzyme
MRPYVDADWRAVLDLCLRAFAPACESLGRLAGADLDWRRSVRRHLRSLTRPGKGGWLVVAELRGSVVGVVNYQVDRETQSGSIGVSAVHPAQQGKGIGSLMYRHVLDLMSAQGVSYATADTGADSSHAPARRAYEKAGFVAVPTVHYFMELRDSGARATGRPPANRAATRRGDRAASASKAGERPRAPGPRRARRAGQTG